MHLRSRQVCSDRRTREMRDEDAAARRRRARETEREQRSRSHVAGVVAGCFPEGQIYHRAESSERSKGRISVISPIAILPWIHPAGALVGLTAALSVLYARSINTDRPSGSLDPLRRRNLDQGPSLSRISGIRSGFQPRTRLPHRSNDDESARNERRC